MNRTSKSPSPGTTSSSLMMGTPLPSRPVLASAKIPTRSLVAARSASASPRPIVAQKLRPPPSRTPREEAPSSSVSRSGFRSAPTTSTHKRRSSDSDEERDLSASRTRELTSSHRTPARDLASSVRTPTKYDRRTPIYVAPPPTDVIVDTPNGSFKIPNFEAMDDVGIMRYMNSYRTKFMQMNEDWKHCGVSFDIPKDDEPVANVAIRYMETEKHLSTRTGSDFWFIILCIGWGFIQCTAIEYGLPAEGYVKSQIANYKMYQSQLIRMGTSSGFGTEWSPWMQVTVTSCANLALLIVLSKMGGPAKEGAPMLMAEISRAITGGTAEVERSSEGTPKPSVGGLQAMATSFLGGGGGDSGGAIDGLLGMVSGMFGGGGSGKKKRSRKQKKKDLEARRGGDDDLDI